MVGETGSIFSSGKKSEVGDNAASLGSSQRIQSSKVPKLNEVSFLPNSSLDSVYDVGGKTRESGEFGDGNVESQESELITAGSEYGLVSHPYVVIVLFCYQGVSSC